MENTNNVIAALLAADDKVEKDVFMKRFGVNFRIRALAGEVIDEIQDRCTFYKGKGNNKKKELDEQLFSAMIIVRGCLNPDWNDPQLKDKHKTHDAAEVVKKALLAGEAAKLSGHILELSGFDEDEEEAIENVKN